MLHIVQSFQSIIIAIGLQKLFSNIPLKAAIRFRASIFHIIFAFLHIKFQNFLHMNKKKKKECEIHIQFHFCIVYRRSSFNKYKTVNFSLKREQTCISFPLNCNSFFLFFHQFYYAILHLMWWNFILMVFNEIEYIVQFRFQISIIMVDGEMHFSHFIVCQTLYGLFFEWVNENAIDKTAHLIRLCRIKQQQTYHFQNPLFILHSSKIGSVSLVTLPVTNEI